jgi:hypothetical protein
MQAGPDISLSRKALLLASAWAAAALAMTIIDPSSWSYFWMFAYCSPVTWILSYAGAEALVQGLVYALTAVGWLYYVALGAAALRSNRRWRTYAIYALLLISLALNVEGCRQWSHASFS